MADKVSSLRDRINDNALETVNETDTGLRVRRFFSVSPRDPLDMVRWSKRSAVIHNEKGEVIFEQHGVEAPDSWSDMAVNVVVSRYFRGAPGTPDRETSVKDLILRVADTIHHWGVEGGYFASEDDATVFRDELVYMLIHQMASFNSPVWFNVGVEAAPQCSACFILSVDDTMDSILNWYRQEGLIFKGGSGSGVNLSNLRSAREPLAGGGTASGPVSFMKAADASAAVIKSGGKTRRAAKMVILNADHPDILDFVRSKAREEAKAHALIRAGYSGVFGDDAYSTVAFQNSNHTVRVTDEFMTAAENDQEWRTSLVLTGEPADTLNAKETLSEIAKAAHICGDPGLQFHSTINRWHTCPETAPIRASNPCSEYMHVDNSACNLASLKLTAFVEDSSDGPVFRADAFQHAVNIMITAQEILVDNSSYPSEAITENSRNLRALGLGYADLGALLMELGLPYDSEAGRAWAGTITALLTGQAYAQSARLASVKGPFAEFQSNREPMLKVIGMHRDLARKMSGSGVPSDVKAAAVRAWDKALELGEQVGFRNCQASVLAPTGTVAFMMDCDTTGIEPEMALVKYKKLAGGGQLKLVNKTVQTALERLGYPPVIAGHIVAKIRETGTIEGIDEVRKEHLPIFDCAFKPVKGERHISHLGHLRMMAAVQPFISGAISKTINLPAESSIADVEEIFLAAWRLGLKAVTVYRDGCKAVQPLNLIDSELESKPAPVRRRLPVDCKSVRHKFEIAGQKGYLHTGFYEDGAVGEIFICMAKEGSTISGLMDTIATLTSIALQYGVPLETLVNKFSHVRFEPSGFTSNPDVPIAKSLTDYIFRYLGTRFLTKEQQVVAGLITADGEPTGQLEQLRENAHVGRLPSSEQSENGHAFDPQSDAPSCPDCGSIMIRNGTCYRCMNCGATTGCS